MNWVDDVLDRLSAAKSWGYHVDGVSASEPAALSALALLAHDRSAAARPAIEWLLTAQNENGSVGADSQLREPGWPAAWAAVAWRAAMRCGLLPEDSTASTRATNWLLEVGGERIERGTGLGHDTTLIGWPWILGTHSWQEPTAISLLSLRLTGQGDHPRAQEATRLLVDRLLEHGGCNYGNTIVFGQELRPHLQPTGVCLLALAGHDNSDPRLGRSIDFLRGGLSVDVGTSSLCCGLLGLAAWNATPGDAPAWLEGVARRTLMRDAASYRLALLALASQDTASPLIPTNGNHLLR